MRTISDVSASIYEQLRSAGVALDNYESDLYAQVTPISRVIIAGYQFRGNVTVFRSQIDGQSWYDIPFAYEPFWEAKQRTAAQGD